jgi:hypothetical protein
MLLLFIQKKNNKFQGSKLTYSKNHEKLYEIIVCRSFGFSDDWKHPSERKHNTRKQKCRY